MSILDWTMTEVVGGRVYTHDLLEDYEIVRRDDKFYARRLVAECDDVGPFDSFDKAESLIFTLNLAIVKYEEATWRVLAAQAMHAEGLISVVEDFEDFEDFEDGPEFADGHDSDGFVGGCDRMGCPPESPCRGVKPDEDSLT